MQQQEKEGEAFFSVCAELDCKKTCFLRRKGETSKQKLGSKPKGKKKEEGAALVWTELEKKSVH